MTGHSIGGMTVLLYAHKDKRLKALVAQSPVTVFGETHITRQLKQAKQEGKKFLEVQKSWGLMRVNISFYDDGIKYDVNEAAEKITCPTLVFHGDKDSTVPIYHSEIMFKHLKKTDEFEVVKGAGHTYKDEGTLDIATKFMIDWFDKHLK